MPNTDERQQRFDWFDDFSSSHTSPATKTKEGFVKATAAITTIGVFTYRNPDGSVRRELRLPEEVFSPDSLATLNLKPLTLLHPTPDQTPESLLNPHTAGELSCGSVGNITTDSYRVYADIMVTREDAINEVMSDQARSLSCGYTCDIEWKSGTWLGQEYDCIQRKIEYNHVALVPRPRAGDDAIIRLDAAGAPGPVPSEYLTTDKDNTNMDMKKVHLDGVEYQAEGPVIAALTKAQEAVAGLNQQLEQSRQDAADKASKVSALEGERDSLKERLDAADKDMPAKVQAAVAARIDLMDKARSAGVEVRSDSSDADLKAAVILKKFPQANLDGKDDAYINARFDAACEMVAQEAEHRSRQDAADIKKNPAQEDKNPLAESLARFNARMDSAWMDKPTNKEA